MAVRRVSNHGGNFIGKFPALKMKRMVMFESLIERDYLYLLDYTREVIQFTEQPLKIDYVFQGKNHTYTPDFHVVRTTGQALVECKPAALTNTDENQRKFAAARLWCAEKEGWEFQVVTDDQIRAGYRLANIKRLTYYARLKIRPDQRGQVYALLLEAQQPHTINTLAQALAPGNPMVAWPVLWHMAFHHEVVIPLDDAPIAPHSPVALPTPL